MKKMVIGLISLLVVLIITIIGIDIYNSAKGYKVEPKSAEVALEQFAKGEDFLLVLGQSWCGGCKAYKKDALPEYLKSDYNEQYPLIYVELDENPESIRKTLTGIANVTSTPTTYLVIDGQIQPKLESGKYIPSFEQIESYIENYE
ncbi:thioredoxin family protein [Haloplasma contractile]|uniref:Thioredoxin domain-containing protein n=1 Tax=Haloplasma contractile SSD-17B TaxID=1033810 RepID=U2EG38_9MOLU|nr:thioredoxin fold domain-containing protein [Haloplasma contractile]ERJ13581.1 thioredoxin domain-containing protein [Haloplasma contractile SSD-17B]